MGYNFPFQMKLLFFFIYEIIQVCHMSINIITTNEFNLLGWKNCDKKVYKFSFRGYVEY